MFLQRIIWKSSCPVAKAYNLWEPVLFLCERGQSGLFRKHMEQRWSIEKGCDVRRLLRVCSWILHMRRAVQYIPWFLVGLRTCAQPPAPVGICQIIAIMHQPWLSTSCGNSNYSSPHSRTVPSSEPDRNWEEPFLMVTQCT